MEPDIKAQVAQLQKDFRMFDRRARTAVEKTIMQAALVVERDAKLSFKGRNAPSVYNEPPRVDTGRLRASITHRGMRDDDVYFQEIGTNVEYASDVEFGTSQTMPHPFLSYALGMNEKDIDRAIAAAIREEAAAAAVKGAMNA